VAVAVVMAVVDLLDPDRIFLCLRDRLMTAEAA